MTTVARALLCVAAVLAVAGPALAQSDLPPGREAAPPQRQNCLLKTLTACKSDGSCAPLDNLKGQKLPVKMTIDVEAGIVAGIDSGGWVDATRIGSAARAGDELIFQGIDETVAWQLLIYEKNRVMSFSLATADGASVGFGDCAVAKER